MKMEDNYYESKSAITSYSSRLIRELWSKKCHLSSILKNVTQESILNDKKIQNDINFYVTWTVIAVRTLKETLNINIFEAYNLRLISSLDFAASLLSQDIERTSDATMKNRLLGQFMEVQDYIKELTNNSKTDKQFMNNDNYLLVDTEIGEIYINTLSKNYSDSILFNDTPHMLIKVDGSLIVGELIKEVKKTDILKEDDEVEFFLR